MKWLFKIWNFVIATLSVVEGLFEAKLSCAYIFIVLVIEEQGKMNINIKGKPGKVKW